MFRRRGRGVELLCLRRSAGRRLGGVWQPVTGKIRRGERLSRAAAREVREETGLEPRRWWALEAPAVYLDPDTEQIRTLPLFAAEVDRAARVRLSSEHDAFEFTSLARAERRFLWDAQRQACGQLRRQILRPGPLQRALDITARFSPAARRTRRSPSREEA